MRLKLPLFFVLISVYSWSQTTTTFTTSGTFNVAAGLTSITAECWGAGGSGGGNDTSSSAAGGGGGAYKKATITVTPNTPINYLVGAGGLGTTASGTNGGPSTFSTVTANGDFGGTSGTGGAAGVGGAGGAAGTGISFAGGKGANGSLLLTLLLSGGGGSSAGTAAAGNASSSNAGGVAVAGGGAGGAGAVLAGDGTSGAVPGGGGGGGLVLLGIGNNKGGNGGNGQIKITYTCPVYSVATTTAANACTVPGSSLVQITSSSLPVGTYTVTYSRSNPSGSNLSATMIVGTAGSGSFTATGLTTAGSSTITITALTSGTCTTPITTTNTATITVSGPSAGGTVAGGTTICSGATSGVLTLSGQTGTVVKWQSSVSPFTAWTDIANTTTTYTSGALTQTTQFRAVVQNGVCSTADSNFTTVNVNPNPTITTGGIVTAVCQNAAVQPASLVYTATTNSPINYSIDWAILTDQASTNFAFNAGGGTINNISVPAGTAAGTYLGVMTIRNANGCFVNQNISLTVNSVAAPTASVTQQPSCQNNLGTITVTLPTPGPGFAYSIDGVNFSNTSGVFTGLAPGLYNVKVKNTTTGCESPSTPLTVNTFAVKMWNGNTDASWGNPANWTPAGVPLASDCVEIPDVGVDPIISGTNGTFFANRLTVDNLGYLVVQGTNTLTVTNEVKVLGGGVFIFENNSSLVQVSNAVNTGNIIYRRDSKPVKFFDLTHWSTPVTRVPIFTLHDFSPNTLWDKYYRFDPVAKWVTIENGIDEMAKGIGYSIRSPQSSDLNIPAVFHGEFIGVPNNGDILGPAGVAEKFSFFGNPYPSAIYADQFIFDNQTIIYGTLYFWTHNSRPTQSVPGDSSFYYSDNDYAIYNLSGSTVIGSMIGTPAPNPGNQDPPLGYIAAAQGFLAKAKTSQRPIFTNSMRVSGRNSQFFKTSETAVIEKNRVWLNMTNTQGVFKQLLIGYITGATNVWDDNYDAVSMDAYPYIDFFSINENKKLVIQGRAIPFVESDTIPLGYRSALEGELTIAIDRADGSLSDQNIYLQDNVTKTMHNLKSGGYTFTTTTGLFPERFVLRYTNSDGTLGNEDFTSADKSISVSVKDKNIKLQSFSDNENLQEVVIYDASGKLLYHKKEIDNKEWLITNIKSGPQVLIVKITLDNERTVAKKIVFN